jgi:PAS domain S-box-containing protein
VIKAVTVPPDQGRAPMRARYLSLLLRPATPPLPLGLVVAVSFVVAETLLVLVLKQVAAGMAFGVIFLLGVLVVSTVWGFGLAVLTSLVSALAFDYFRSTPADFMEVEAEDWVVVGTFLAVALVANSLAFLARARAEQLDQRRREADLAAELAGLMLRAGDLHSSLDTAAQRLAQALGLSSAGLELGAVPADDRHSAIPLCDGATVLGTLLIPAELPKPKAQRLRERVVPSLEALLAAARDREAISDALQASRKELERFFELSSDLTGIAGFDGHFKRVNPAFEGTLGYSSPELVSRPFLHFIHPEDRSTALQRFVEFSHRHVAARFEGRCICRDGSVVWLEWNVVADQDLIYAAARDVTERRMLAEQQASLRRVATLVARGVAPSEVFSAVVSELARVLGVWNATLFRYEPDDTAELLAARDEPGLTKMPVGERFPLGGEDIASMVYRTGRTARMDNDDTASGPAAARIRELGLRSGVGVPIVVGGRVWGAAIVGSSRPEPLPPGTEVDMADFTDLIATAIANAEARAQLTASRARIVAAADDARRRFERDLHDGAQQRLVSLALQLRTAEASVPPELQPLKEQIAAVVVGLAGATADLQELSRGIHPAILSKGGLGPALKTLARRSAVPVTLRVGVDRRLREPAEVAAYYVVTEGLTNVAKHAQASEVMVSAELEGANLRLSIQDDGSGGADSGRGSGLTGLVDRVEALGGSMEIKSRAGSGTSLVVIIPVEAQ